MMVVAASTDCPACGARLDGATNAYSGRECPAPGDVGICIYCARIHVFGDNGSRRRPTDAEAIELAKDERVSRAISVVKTHGPRDPGKRRPIE